MHGFTGILLHMNPLDPHLARHAGRHIDQYLALANNRVVKLGYLVALRQVGVEIILAVKARKKIDLGLQAKAGAHCLLDAKFVDHRQHAGHGGINKGNIGIGRIAKPGARPGKKLGIGGDLGMHFQPDHQLPVGFCPGNHFGFWFGIGEFAHGQFSAVLAHALLSKARAGGKGCGKRFFHIWRLSRGREVF